MNILVLNASPRKNGMVSSILKNIIETVSPHHNVEWIDVNKLDIKYCTGCMACRKQEKCVLPQDDAHIIGEKIKNANALVIGTPTYWGNITAPLKLLFDRTVPVFMGESAKGIPIPKQKGKRAIIVTACTTPWPFNVILPESRGAVHSVKKVLNYGGYKIIGTLVKPGSKKSREISPALMNKAKRLGKKLK